MQTPAVADGTETESPAIAIPDRLGLVGKPLRPSRYRPAVSWSHSGPPPEVSS